jgi:hypothetical protein
MEELEVFYSVYALYLWAGLAAVVLLIGLWLLALQFRLGRMAYNYQVLMAGVDEGNLEDALERQVAYLLQTGQRIDALGQEIQSIGQTLERALQRVGVVRFNPFSDTGGDQSFSIALLDAHGDGVVVSSLFSRSETRVFAKPVQAGQSKYTLSEEEAQAIQLALSSSSASRAR